MDNDSKEKNMINKLQKENDKLKKTNIVYELKLKKYRNLLSKKKFQKLSIKNFNFSIIKAPKKNVSYREKKNQYNIINKMNYKDIKSIIPNNNSFSLKNLDILKNLKNFSLKRRKYIIKNIKKTNTTEKTNEFLTDRTYTIFDRPSFEYKKDSNSLSYREMLYKNHTINTKSKKDKILANTNKNIRPNVLRVYQHLTKNQKHLYKMKNSYDESLINSVKKEKTKVREKKKKLIFNMVNNNSIIHKVMKNEETNKKESSSSQKKISQTQSNQNKFLKTIKSNKIKGTKTNINHPIHAQKPIINKITIYNNINNGYNSAIKSHSGRKILEKNMSYNKYNNPYYYTQAH